MCSRSESVQCPSRQLLSILLSRHKLLRLSDVFVQLMSIVTDLKLSYFIIILFTSESKQC